MSGAVPPSEPEAEELGAGRRADTVEAPADAAALAVEDTTMEMAVRFQKQQAKVVRRLTKRLRRAEADWIEAKKLDAQMKTGTRRSAA